MASAGRVLPLPKGAYSSSTTYHLLDFVSYQGSTYICKQTSTGNAPTNTTYWQIMAQGTESASVAGNYYGTCSTGASTSAKIVSIPATENFVLQVGDIIGIKFDNTNTANNPSLNVNNSGAKPIYYNNSAVSTSNLWASGEANRVTIFMYDGTNWIWMGHDVDIDTDTLSDLKDTTISSASNGQVLMYDSASGKWKNQTPTTTLAGLSDTQISSATDGQVLKYNSTSQKWVNGEDKGGILPHLIVISETGSTVTATKGQTVITATETSTGHFECDLTELGTWTIDAILGGDDAQVSLVVDTVKVYTVDDSHFHATLTVKYPDGATCRLQSADETLYATGSPYTFTVHHAETYTITVTYNQRIYTDTVTFTTEGQSFSKTLPSPSEVDANDINWWLFFGGVSGTFSSLDEILANSTALSMLMASTDAVDYLVRCTDWANNEGLVPVMTSSTTPSGVVSASSEFDANYAGWKAFDRNTSTFWSTPAIQPNTHSSGAYIKYDFGNGNKKNIGSAKITFNHTDYIASWSFVIQGSNDDSNWVDISNTQTSKDTEQTIICNNTNAYRYIRIYWNDTLMGSTSAGTGRIVECQFYPLTQGVNDSQNAMTYIGLNNYCANTLLADADWFDGIVNSEYFESVLNVKVPTMTSNTTPSGECFITANATEDRPAYYVFNPNITAYSPYHSSLNIANASIGYKFTSAKKVVAIWFQQWINTGGLFTKYKIQGSNDNSIWVDVSDELTVSNPTANAEVFQGFVNTSNFEYYRLKYVTASDTYIGVTKLQFYGREDV